MKAKDIMTRDIVTVSAGMKVKDLAMTLIKNQISGAPVVGKDGNLGDAALVSPLGNRYFWDGSRHWLYWKNLRHIHRRYPKQQVISVRADGTGPRLDNVICLVPLCTQRAAACQQVLPQRAHKVIAIHDVAQRFSATDQRLFRLLATTDCLRLRRAATLDEIRPLVAA